MGRGFLLFLTVPLCLAPNPAPPRSRPLKRDRLFRGRFVLSIPSIFSFPPFPSFLSRVIYSGAFDKVFQGARREFLSLLVAAPPVLVLLFFSLVAPSRRRHRGPLIID